MTNKVHQIFCKLTVFANKNDLTVVAKILSMNRGYN